jgi:hypothetical protein
MREPNRGACARGAQLLVDRALDNLKAAGHLLKAAGVREEEVGVLVANAFLHARRAVPHLAELVKVFPDRQKAGA